MRSYAEAVRRLYALEPRGIRLELDRVRRASRRLGDPGERFPSVHVAGTNGKGSVAAMVDSILRAAGLSVGLYTSPHLLRFTERIRIDGRELGKRELVKRLARLEEKLAGAGAPELTFFETTTLLALDAFAARPVDLGVIEVGLGGRLDATRVVRAAVTVVTRIGLNHCDRLGDTLEQIAVEKLGIVRAQVPLVTGVEQPAVLDLVQRTCRSRRVPLLAAGRDFVMQPVPGRAGRWVYAGRAGRVEDLRIGLPGPHQIGNAGLAVTCALLLRERGHAVDDAAIRRGLARVQWPARLETIEGIVLDAAHNVDGAQALARALRERCAPASVELVFGVMLDKDVEGMLAALSPLVRRVVFTRPRIGRARDPAELARALGGEAEPDLARALARARRRSGTVVVTGSIYTVAEARALLLGETAEPLI